MKHPVGILQPGGQIHETAALGVDRRASAGSIGERLDDAHVLGERPSVDLWIPAPEIEPRHVRHVTRSEEHTSELQSHVNLVCRLLLEKKKKKQKTFYILQKKKKKKK